MGIYTVRASDSLASISQKFRVPTEVIKRMNGLLSTAVVPGLALYIPDNDLPTQFYQVRRGDTLAGIARHFHTSSKRIQQANPSVRFHAGVRLRIPTPIRYQMETVGFVIPSEINNLRPLFQQIASQLTYLAIFSYSVNPDGTLNGVDDRLAITASRSRGVRPLMVLTNWVGDRFDPVLIGRISANPTLRSTLIRHVIDTLNTKGYGGVSVDFEFVPPESRNNFTALIRELKGAMGPGLILHLNAHPKTSDLPSNRIVGAFDYAVLGAIVDRIAIMAIEHGYPSGPPNPIAPIWWVEQVIRYATSQIDRRKMMLALPFHGYDWPVPTPAGTTASVASVEELQNRAIQNNAPIEYNTAAQAPTYTYSRGGQQHKVWFEDPRSLEAKYQLVEIYNLLGVTFWHLNYQFPQNWPYVSKNFSVKRI